MAYPYPGYAAFFPPPMDFGRHGSSSSGRDRSRDRSRSRSRDRQRSSKDLQDKNGRTGGDSERTAQTVFISGLHPKVDDVEIFEFFSNAGRVDDVQLIKDSRTGKSKGLCYVEMSSVEEAHKAALLHGQSLGGYPINVTICAAKAASTTGAKAAAAANPNGLRLYVGSLHYNISESDLTPIFEAFGPIDSVEVHRDATNTSKGFAFVSFRAREDGETAMAALDGYEIAGRPIKVSYASPTDGPNSKNPRPPQPQTATSGITPQLLAAASASAVASAPAAPAPLSAAQLTPSCCVLVANMFNPAEETDADWARDLQEDVEEECGKFGKVQHIHVDPVDPAGKVYLRFAQQEAAVKGQKALHGRWFANRQLTAGFMPDDVYAAKFPVQPAA